LVWSYDR